jgi:hypothetical protein
MFFILAPKASKSKVFFRDSLLSASSSILNSLTSLMSARTIRVRRDYLTDEVEPEILFEDPQRADGVAASRAGLLEFPSVVLDTLPAEGVEALFQSDGVLKHIEADWAEDLVF